MFTDAQYMQACRRVSPTKDYENITVVPSRFVDSGEPLRKIIIFNRRASVSYTKLDVMRRNNLMCDVSLLAADGDRIDAHKCVLAANSEYFEKMFSGGFKETGRRRVHMERFGSDVLRMLVSCIYTSELHVTEHNVQDLLSCSDFLQLEDVRAVCLDLISAAITPQNCLVVKDVAYCRGMDGLYADCLSFALNNFESIAKAGQLTKTSYEQIVELIKSDELAVSKEETVFDLVLDWVRYDPGRRTRYLDELLDLVRLPLVFRRFGPKQLLDCCNSDCLRMLRGPDVQSVEAAKVVKIRRRNPNTGNVILVFGHSERHTSNAAELLDVRDGRWQSCASVPPPDVPWSTCVSLDDGRRLMAVGGVDATSAPSAGHALTLDRRGRWTAVRARCSAARRTRLQPGVARLGRRVYAIGGRDVTGRSQKNAEYYDVQVEEWHEISSMTCWRDCFGTVVLNGSIYVLGGLGENRTSQNSAERYDPETDSWSPIAPMQQRRHSAMVCALNDSICVAGGSCDGTALSDAEIYCPGTNTWTRIASMNAPRCLGSAVTLDGLVYVIGGCHQMHVLLDSIETFDLRTNIWTISSEKLKTGSWFNKAIVLDRNHDVLKCENI